MGLKRIRSEDTRIHDRESRGSTEEVEKPAALLRDRILGDSNWSTLDDVGPFGGEQGWARFER